MYSLIVVDDEKELREGLAGYFPWEKNGFSVVASFSNGQDALLWVKDHKVDVVLTDIRMPFMSGLELAEKIQAFKGDSIVFCLLSAYRDFAYAHQGMRLGIRHYLLKPTNYETLGKTFDEIRKELDGRESRMVLDSPVYGPVVQKTWRIMSAHPDTVSLQSLSVDLGISTAYLSRLFKEETGRNFSVALTKLRMEKAAGLLQCRFQYTNKEISTMLGYEDPRSFCRSFHRFYHMTPGEYRKGCSRMLPSKQEKELEP